jgi:hypothetical protein
MSDAVGQLGHRSYPVREKATRSLIAAGRPALSFLRPALDSPDLEVARRAERAIGEIERVSYVSLLTAAVRVLADRKPAGVTEGLLAFSPFSQEEEVDQALREALLISLDRNGQHPAIRAALSDREPKRRAAAAFVLGRLSPPSVKELAGLLKDPSSEVRFQAAEALLRGKDRAGIPVLLALLEEGTVGLGRRAEEVLFLLAGDSAPAVSLGMADDASRRRCRETWIEWWTNHADQIDLTRLLAAGTPLGLTLYCLYDSPSSDGRIVLAGSDGKPRWEITGLQGPNDARLLPGGRVLIAERNNGRVTERDSTGRIIWERRVEGGALAADRLPGGNTLIANWSQVFEVGPDGKAVWEYTHPGGFRHVSRMKNGRLLAVTAAGQVLELDRAGKLMRTVTPERHGGGAGYWASVEQTVGGKYLTALGSSRRVVEVDDSGKIGWEAEVPNAVFATRLSNGHTLVCNFEECHVIELDRTGKEIARHRTAGRPFAVRRY